MRILFLEASDEALVRRYEKTRRRHPMDECERVAEGIAKERSRLEAVKSEADVVVDTSDLNVHQLRDHLVELSARSPRAGCRPASSRSGTSRAAARRRLVFDCRFPPNPHWVKALRPLTGLDAPVGALRGSQPETAEFLARLDDLLGLLLPAYVTEGKRYLWIGVGCTGGRHRSVDIAEAIGELLREPGLPTEGHPPRPWEVERVDGACSHERSSPSGADTVCR